MAEWQHTWKDQSQNKPPY